MSAILQAPASAIDDAPSSEELADARPPAFSDEALALRFAERHHHELRYVAAWGRWYLWDGMRWKPDDTLRAFDLARAVCRVASSECNQEKVKVAVASAKTSAAVERLAKADRRLAATVDQWDREAWLLNTPGGTIELRTGKIRPHSREDYTTKLTAAAPGVACPNWQVFLDRITGGDTELQSFLKRIAGYALTGLTREHALFFLFGTGANGKSVLLSVMSGVLGDYATTAPMETFIASNADRHPTDLAGLRGARLVTAAETEEGRRWAESRIKSLTGGDKISARFMRHDFFEYKPQFKLVIAGNHKSALGGVDEAIRRRMNLIPFAVTIPPEERDHTLPEKLREEWPGILQWMIDGCQEWQADGLAQPESVRRATTEYIDDEDAIGQWLQERCIRQAGRYATAAELFADWQTWAGACGEPVGSQKRLSLALKARGVASKRQARTGKGGFESIALKRASTSDEDAGEGW